MALSKTTPPLFDGQQAAAWDKDTIAKGLPSAILMAMAAQSVFDALLDALLKEERLPTNPKFIVLCGPGNNGGDGYVLSWLLAGISKTKVHIYKTTKPGTADALLYHNLCASHPNISISSLHEIHPRDINKNTVLVDGIFGSGFNRGLTDDFSKLFAALNKRPCYRVSIDTPSGVYADGRFFEHTPFLADLTLCIGATKVGLLVTPGILYSEKTVTTNTAFLPAPKSSRRMAYPQQAPPLRKVSGHKYDSGVLHIWGGSKGMQGSALLTGRAFLSLGGGLCHWHTSSAEAVASLANLPEIMIHHESDNTLLQQNLLGALHREKQPLLAMGMGLRETIPADFLKNLLTINNLRLVIDASALRQLYEYADLLRQRKKNITVVLTPHLGEAEALLGKPIDNIIKAGVLLAQKYNCFVFMKGPGGLLCRPDGSEVYFASREYSLATGGTGDVLAGVIANFLLRFQDSFIACEQAILCHSRAAGVAKNKDHLTASGLIALLREQHGILQQVTQ